MQKSAGFLVLHSLFFDDVVEKFATWSVLHDEKQLPAGFNDLVELDDVRVSDNLENLNFSHDSRNICLLLDFVLLKNLYGHLFMSDLVNSQSHFTKSTLPDGFA